MNVTRAHPNRGMTVASSMTHLQLGLHQVCFGGWSGELETGFVMALSIAVVHTVRAALPLADPVLDGHVRVRHRRTAAHLGVGPLVQVLDRQDHLVVEDAEVLEVYA